MLRLYLFYRQEGCVYLSGELVFTRQFICSCLIGGLFLHRQVKHIQSGYPTYLLTLIALCIAVCDGLEAIFKPNK